MFLTSNDKAELIFNANFFGLFTIDGDKRYLMAMAIIFIFIAIQATLM